MRITKKDLDAVCKRINIEMCMALEPYTKVDGKYIANIGNYHLSGAYGGYALHRMCNQGGGITDIFHGHMPKRDLYGKMHAYLDGIYAEKTRGDK